MRQPIRMTGNMTHHIFQVLTGVFDAGRENRELAMLFDCFIPPLYFFRG